MYRVQFICHSKPGAGYIDGYDTARRAKQVVAKVNAQFAKDGLVSAVYLGKRK